MDYQGTIIRPPGEADSILLQVAAGCPHNACAFCGAYVGERYRPKDEAVVLKDIEWAARHLHGHSRRIFLCGGDAMALPVERLKMVLTRLKQAMPGLTRVSTYASARSLLEKGFAELAGLSALGLRMVHMGLESGDDAVLASMNKKISVAEMLEAASMVRQAGMKLCVTVITGLGGVQGWERHARLTGEALSAMQPEQAAALTLIPVPGTRLHRDMEAGRFLLPDARAMTVELRLLLEHTRLERGLFLADHASNHVPLKLRLPRDKEFGLELLDNALRGRVPLRPDHARGL